MISHTSLKGQGENKINGFFFFLILSIFNTHTRGEGRMFF